MSWVERMLDQEKREKEVLDFNHQLFSFFLGLASFRPKTRIIGLLIQLTLDIMVIVMIFHHGNEEYEDQQMLGHWKKKK